MPTLLTKIPIPCNQTSFTRGTQYRSVIVIKFPSLFFSDSYPMVMPTLSEIPIQSNQTLFSRGTQYRSVIVNSSCQEYIYLILFIYDRIIQWLCLLLPKFLFRVIKLCQLSLPKFLFRVIKPHSVVGLSTGL